ncbi:hypothetical protein SAMN04488527_1762 [Aliiroseovarius crassostreae]|uniref:Uncharacterized protein n=1 Tax=Aliiroseovarius crassostreae TaxID=154981 RepID=A0A0N8IBB4_9RHOB|nr:hypothetical protein [Aliiroseovarius crassostreae]KPN62635.1 hypothetical protein AKJ29_00050 [Aliiroseovarius crassostreae]SFU98922.1 hypothetical protein SAMN04488527_1762 [Aliiroseovarius crassostreae]
MKKVLIAIAFLMVGYVVIAMWWSPRPTPLFIPPVTLADGSVEYQLIDFGADRERGTEDDPIWVLQFPEDIYVSNPDVSQTGELIARDPAWKNNWNLTLIMRMPDFGPLIDPFGEQRSVDKIRVALTAPEVEYGTGRVQAPGMDHAMSFSSVRDRMVNIDCRKGPLIAPGLVSLRNATPSEQSETRRSLEQEFGPDSKYLLTFDGECPWRPNGYEAFALLGASGEILGTGDCQTEPLDRPYCSFFVWLPENRIAQLRFDAKYLVQTREIYQRVVEIIAQATSVRRFPHLSE